MFLSAVSVLVVVQLSSEVPEGLMNYPVYSFIISSGSKQKEPRYEGFWTCSCWTQLHVQQPSTYAKPEAASAVLVS